MSTKMIRFNVFLSQQQRKRLDRESRQLGISVAELVRRKIDANVGESTNGSRGKSCPLIGAREVFFVGPKNLCLSVSDLANGLLVESLEEACKARTGTEKIYRVLLEEVPT